MISKIYVKDSTGKIPVSKKGVTFTKYKSPKLMQRDRYLFASISAIGVLAILAAIGPFLIWQFKTAPNINQTVDKVPVPKSQVLSAETIYKNVEVAKESDGFSYFTTNDIPVSSVKVFNITIPKIQVEDALVKTNSLNFDNNLGHFPGSPLPGEVGNSFVTGHSVLPEFFNEKNYKTIFSNLEDLEVGDEIFVDISGKRLQFAVQYKKIVDPKDVSVLAPISKNGRNLTLMTCVPPGSSLKRMVVVTSLI